MQSLGSTPVTLHWCPLAAAHTVIHSTAPWGWGIHLATLIPTTVTKAAAKSNCLHACLHYLPFLPGHHISVLASHAQMWVRKDLGGLPDTVDTRLPADEDAHTLVCQKKGQHPHKAGSLLLSVSSQPPAATHPAAFHERVCEQVPFSGAP